MEDETTKELQVLWDIVSQKKKRKSNSLAFSCLLPVPYECFPLANREPVEKGAWKMC